MNINIYNVLYVVLGEIYKFKILNVNFPKIKKLEFVWRYEFFCLPL